MAKGARASNIKSNNQALKSKVFGPVETERTARLSAKLLELASQPKPARDVVMKTEDAPADEKTAESAPSASTNDMEVDKATTKTSARPSKGRVEKRKTSSRKASIVFPKYVKGKKTAPKGKKQKIY